MPTVIIGSALDITQTCFVPRFLFVDFPLGNPCGKPWDAEMQARIVEQGVGLFEQAKVAGHIEHSQEEWGSDEWRENYMAVTDENRSELASRGEALRAQRSQRVKRD